MMNLTDIELMRSDEFRDSVLQNIERDPVAIALDKRVAHAALVATQVKYLQRARYKLPRMYEAGCIILPRAFEQSSSEQSAQVKPMRGGRLLDLTCGLGIDTMAFAENFDHVTSLEQDEVLAEVVRYNLGVLGLDNVEVITTSAEEYVAATNERYDWIFADPDRRSAEGKKMVRMEDCSPNVVSLMPRLRELAGRVGLKLSPLFDAEEAFRLFPGSEVEVVSIGGECKELNIYTDATRELLRIVVVGSGVWEFSSESMHERASADALDVSSVRYLIAPDVALQKARVAIAAFADIATIYSNNGFAYATELPDRVLPARIYAVERMERYNPKQLKREFKGVGVEILKRDTSLSIDAVRKATGMHPGAERMMAITTIAGENWVIHIKPLS